MTKLEQKLIELGYRSGTGVSTLRPRWFKEIDSYKHWIAIELYNGKIDKVEINSLDYNETNNLQQAFNQLQNDLKELKELC